MGSTAPEEALFTALTKDMFFEPSDLPVQAPDGSVWVLEGAVVVSMEPLFLESGAVKILGSYTLEEREVVPHD